MPRSWSIRHYLLALVLAMALPLVGLLAYSLHRNHVGVVQLAGASTSRLTDLAAADTARFIRDTRGFLRELAARPMIRHLDPGDCDPVLLDIKALFPQFANIALVNRDGQMLCSALSPGSASLPNFASSPWFVEARTVNRFHIGAIHKGPISGKWVVVMSEPIQDERGQFGGLVGYSLDLTAYPLLLAQETALPSGMSLVVLDRAGTVLMRSSQSPEQIGQAYSAPQLLALTAADHSGYAMLTAAHKPGIDEEILAWAPVADTNWRVIATRPAAPVLAALGAEAGQQYGVAALLILLGSILAMSVSRQIIRPIQHIADTASLVTAGDFGQRAQADGPGEINAFATHFNHMLDVRLNAEVRFRDLLESASDGIIVVNSHGGIMLANDQAAHTFGYDRAELTGLSVHALVPGEQQQEHARLAADFLAAAPEGRAKGRMFRGLRKDGSIFPCDISLSPLRTEDGVMVTAVVRDLTERLQLEEQLSYLAQHDALTDLPNRSLLADRLEQAMMRADREDGRVALIQIDIDRFGELNDFHGAAVADRILKACAQRIRASLRDVDSVVRSGSDEFIAIIEDAAAETVALQFVERVRQALRESFGQTAPISVVASFGIALYPCPGGADELLRNGDLALLQAKKDGGDTFRFFEAEMNARASHRVELLAQLREAIARDELSLLYQPQVNTVTGQISGVEALLRWHNPGLGAVSPARFIPLAEESGLIDSIGEWVLRQACQQAAAWRAAGLPVLSMAVNLSARQFSGEKLIPLVASALAQSQMPAGQLELEITEGMLMQDPEGAVAVVRALHDMGVRIAIDDFGTGYSSLSYLRRFPVHVLKVDQSFVRDVPDSADAATIVAAVVSLAHSLRLGVIAEGVETEPQRQFLADLQCDTCQGYLFSRPVPPAKIIRLVHSGPSLLPASGPVP